MKIKFKITKSLILNFCKFFILNFLLFISISFALTSVDDNYQDNFAKILTQEAVSSPNGFSVMETNMKIKGNSDYFIYEDNELQNFQMRNQLYDGIKNYVFPGYIPRYNGCAFKINNLECTALVTESKFQPNNFYFSLSNSFDDETFQIPRTIARNEILIIDQLAEKLLPILGCNDFSELINKNLTIKTTSFGANYENSYKIISILNTNSNLGKSLVDFFGDNIIFCSDYNQFQFEGRLYCFASSDLNENTDTIKFITNKYKTTKTTSRSLESGYIAEYYFYHYDNGYKISENNEDYQKILNFYMNTSSLIVSLVGIVLTLVNLIFTIISISKTKKSNEFSSRVKFIFLLWAASCFAMVLFSFINLFSPTTQLLIGVRMINSSFISASIILSFVFLVIMQTTCAIIGKK